MPIKKATAFTASDGSLCATLEEAQRHELALLWMANAKLNEQAAGTVQEVEAARDAERQHAVEFSHLVQTNADAILDILTTGPRSRPAARKSKGTNNPKRAAKVATAEQARVGFKSMRTAADADAVLAGEPHVNAD